MNLQPAVRVRVVAACCTCGCRRLQTQPARDKESVERRGRELAELKERLKGYEQVCGQ